MVFFFYPNYDACIPDVHVDENGNEEVEAEGGESKSKKAKHQISLLTDQSGSGGKGVVESSASARDAGSFGEFIKKKWLQVSRAT